MKRNIILILIVLSSVTSFAVTEDSFSIVQDKSVGFSFMVTNDCYNSLGMSYQQWLPHGIGVQATVGGGFAKYNVDSFLSVQLELQKLFFAHRFDTTKTKITTSLFGYLAGGFTCYEDKYYETLYDQRKDNYYEVYHEEFLKVFGFGLGLGVDVIFSDHISIPFTMGFMGQFLNNPAFGLSAGAGILYRF